MQLKPYKHPLLGWYFACGPVMILDHAVHIHHFAFKWNPQQPVRYIPELIARLDEPYMWIWLKFNISFAGGWGIGLTYK